MSSRGDDGQRWEQFDSAPRVSGGPCLDDSTHWGGPNGPLRRKNPDKVEKDQMRSDPPDDWIHFGHLMLGHGRWLCAARQIITTAGYLLEDTYRKVGAT